MRKYLLILQRMLRLVVVAAVSVLGLFLMLAVALYVPPVQRWAVKLAAGQLERSLGMQVSIGQVRLAFPLSLALGDMLARQGADTVVAARALRIDVRLWPLVLGHAEVKGIGLYDARLRTLGLIPDVGITGRVGELSLDGADVAWGAEEARLRRLTLREADVRVVLADTAQADTTPSGPPPRWKISVERFDVRRTHIHLTLPGDSMRLGADLGWLALQAGTADLGAGRYGARSLKINRSGITYDIPQAAAATAGLDPNHLVLRNVRLQVDTFSYHLPSGSLRACVPLLQLTEQHSGLTLSRTHLSLNMDSTRLSLPRIEVATPYSALKGHAAFDFNALTPGRGGTLNADLDLTAGQSDIARIAGPLLPKNMRPLLPEGDLTLNLRLQGNLTQLEIPQAKLQVARLLTLQLNGQVARPLQPELTAGALNASLRLQEKAGWLTDALTHLGIGGLNLPPGLQLSARLTAHPHQHYGVKAHLLLPAADKGKGGSLELEANYAMHTAQYALSLQSRHLPLRTLLPALPLSPVTARITAHGQGFDPFSPRCRLKAEAHIGALQYDTLAARSLHLTAQLAGGRGGATYVINSPIAQLRGMLRSEQGPDGVRLTMLADCPEVRLKSLGLTTDTLDVGAYLRLEGYTNRRLTRYGLTGKLSNIHISTEKMGSAMKDIDFAFHTSPDTSRLSISAGDFSLRLAARGSIETLGRQAAALGHTIRHQLANAALDYTSLKAALPEADLYILAGRDNPLSGMARLKGYDFNRLLINLRTDTVQGLTGQVALHTLKAQGWQLDTVGLRMTQDTRGFKLTGGVVNAAPDNPDIFRINVGAYLYPRDAGLQLTFTDKNGQRGADVGLRAQVEPGRGVRFSLKPGRSILAYRTFDINADNYLYWGRNKLIRAHIDLKADDGTALRLTGEPTDSINDLRLALAHISLDELSRTLPYMPRIGGMLEADVHVRASGNDLTARADVQTQALTYEGIPLGNIGAAIAYQPGDSGLHRASLMLSLDGQNVLLAGGSYDSQADGYFDGTAQLTHFPLALANGFMAGTDVMLRGTAGGRVSVSGALSQPRVSGSLMLTDTHVYSDVYGFDFRLADDSLRLHHGRLDLERFRLYSTGKNPLEVNGHISLADFSRPTLDVSLTGHDFEVINAKRKTRSLLYGRIMADVQGRLRGSLDNLFLSARLNVLGGTDMTYILKDSPLSVDDRLQGLVEFVNFNDTTAADAAQTPPPPSSMDMSLTVNISETAHFHCDLSDDKQSYVDLEGGGNLNLRIPALGDMRLTGQFTVTSGEMKYALPVIPLKTFTIQPGSSVAFTGDVTNPTLNITAKERIKASVTENDAPRSVAFDVGVAITKPLQEMGLSFIVEAPEDLSVQNQLAAMTQEQRSKTAVTLLATGMYMTDEGLNTSGLKATGALNAFLQNEIQNITAGALSTIDINVGVESGTSAVGTATTDYSFQFAKRFWGNRMSIIIGGKVSTGADAHNSAESFIDNVSLEYRLDEGSTRYIKVYYDRSANDPLEGQLTKTGAGLVLRRKTNRLGELFLFRTPRPERPAANPPAAGPDPHTSTP